MARIYVGTYAKYNAGSIAGDWLDLEDYTDGEDFHAACLALHADESDPELMFQDWEDIPAGFISESHLDADVWDWLALSDYEREILADYRDNVNQSGTLEQAQGAYQGTADSEEDYAYQHVEDTGLLGDCPDDIKRYFDYVAFGRDLFLNGLTLTDTGRVFRTDL